MKAYLVENEINELKGLRHQNVDYSKLNDLKKFLEKNGKTLSLHSGVNANNVYDILFAKHQGSILNNKTLIEYREQHPNIECDNWKQWFFDRNLSQIDPDGFDIYNIARFMNLEDNRKLIEDKLKQIRIENFNLDGFLFNKDFDFTPYLVSNSDKKENDSIADATTNILNLFDGITKNLSVSDKELYKNNFLQILEYVVKNVTINDITNKDNVFRNLLNYIDEKRTKK